MVPPSGSMDEAPVLRRTLLRITDTLHACHSHFNFFLRPISTVQLPDYGRFVRKDQSMDFGIILDRVNADKYESLEEFRADVAGIHANACAYNSPGAGELAYEPVIHWAEELLQLTDKLIQAVQLEASPGNSAGCQVSIEVVREPHACERGRTCMHYLGSYNMAFALQTSPSCRGT